MTGRGAATGRPGRGDGDDGDGDGRGGDVDGGGDEGRGRPGSATRGRGGDVDGDGVDRGRAVRRREETERESDFFQLLYI